MTVRQGCALAVSPSIAPARRRAAAHARVAEQQITPETVTGQCGADSQYGSPQRTRVDGVRIYRNERSQEMSLSLAHEKSRAAVFEAAVPARESERPTPLLMGRSPVILFDDRPACEVGRDLRRILDVADQQPDGPMSPALTVLTLLMLVAALAGSLVVIAVTTP